MLTSLINSFGESLSKERPAKKLVMQDWAKEQLIAASSFDEKNAPRYL
jgi:hypothetical protein